MVQSPCERNVLGLRGCRPMLWQYGNDEASRRRSAVVMRTSCCRWKLLHSLNEEMHVRIGPRLPVA